MKPVIIFGIGRYASLVHHYLTREGKYKVKGFSVNREYLSGETICDLKVYPFEDVQKQFPPNDFEMIVAVGYSRMNSVREQKCREAKEKGYHLASFIHSSNILWDGFQPGENSIIFEGNVFQPYSKIGQNVCVWAGSVISHHAELGNNVYVAPGAVISGGVKIGDNSFIGSNATVRNDVKVGKNCIVGAGVVILKDIKDDEVYSALEPRLLPVKSQNMKNI